MDLKDVNGYVSRAVVPSEFQLDAGMPDGYTEIYGSIIQVDSGLVEFVLLDGSVIRLNAGQPLSTSDRLIVRTPNRDIAQTQKTQRSVRDAIRNYSTQVIDVANNPG